MRRFHFTSGRADGNLRDMSGHVDRRAGRVRNVRLALGLSQRKFAIRLGVSLESYRPWDSGRRETPDEVNRRAPEDFDRQLVALRTRLRISQTQLATRIGAAGKAVIYQWESRKRRPSPILWQRVSQLAALPIPGIGPAVASGRLRTYICRARETRRR